MSDDIIASFEVLFAIIGVATILCLIRVALTAAGPRVDDMLFGDGEHDPQEKDHPN